MIVHMLISDGGSLSLAQLPESLQELLTRELGAIRLVDRDTVSAVADEFANELDAVGMSAPGTHDGAILSLADHLSPRLASRLRAQTALVRNGDYWPTIVELPVEKLIAIMANESIEVSAIALSKLPIAKASEVLQKTQGERARRITYAMSHTGDVSPDAVRRIGAALAQDYGTAAEVAFDKAPVSRLGAILNSTVTDTREDVLEGLDERDPEFANNVRKAIFTFKDITTRVKPTDVPNCIRAVDNDVLTKAIASALKADEATNAAAEYILANISQRMAEQIREDAAEMGKIKKADAEAAMGEITKAIREMAETGMITYMEPDEEDEVE
ncbi:flagellar motor switch protein FliG [Yoonia sediminilitoris]|uniref:Flagellar motor switch protein FliG n=2 Tax=Yoonia sediminilitoris TaxID=1286148 RepID=A0A2T6KDP9_9RHOB|nr:flagellar motor switch protein FliG [Yoonia sediminilitoris]RCW94509.1 flagellar motor switch protein FliG [Yoonia sediminilitoris]